MATSSVGPMSSTLAAYRAFMASHPEFSVCSHETPGRGRSSSAADLIQSLAAGSRPGYTLGKIGLPSEIMVKPLSTHRSNFTWARNLYNKSDDAEQKEKYARLMAKYLGEGAKDSFRPDEIARGLDYPSEVEKYLTVPASDCSPEISEDQIRKEVAAAVDTDSVLRIGEGTGSVYGYGYACCPDRLKVGSATGDTIQRIADQIYTSTPDKPVLHLEIRTDDCRGLERAIHSVLRVRRKKIIGGGDEWFRTTREEVVAIYQFISDTAMGDSPE